MFIPNKQLTIMFNLEPCYMNPQTVNSHLIKELREKMEGKSFPKVGKIIKIKKILKFQDGKIHHDTGCAKIMITFTCDVFQPSVDEVLVGQISKLDSSGVYVDHEGMVDIFCLNVQSFFNSLEKSNKSNKSNNRNQSNQMQLKIGDVVTLKITKVNLNEHNLVLIGKLL